jgi:hypothetical protein
LVVVATVVAFRLIGQVDWEGVWRAMRHLAWWQVPLLLALLLVRQLLNSLPLALFIAGLSPYRAFLNDQVAVLIGTMFPPPSDLALRTAMFDPGTSRSPRAWPASGCTSSPSTSSAMARRRSGWRSCWREATSSGCASSTSAASRSP